MPNFVFCLNFYANCQHTASPGGSLEINWRAACGWTAMAYTVMSVPRRASNAVVMSVPRRASNADVMYCIKG